MIIDHVDNRPVPRYLIYDIVKFDVSRFMVFWLDNSFYG